MRRIGGIQFVRVIGFILDPTVAPRDDRNIGAGQEVVAAWELE